MLSRRIAFPLLVFAAAAVVGTDAAEVSGLIQPFREATLSATVVGRINQINFKDGESVAAGAIILELDKGAEEIEAARRKIIWELKAELEAATARVAMVIGEAGQPGAISIATNMAGRGTDIRIPARVAEQGGLAVIATERHESGRIDRQLFGRSARQGDPGTAQAFVSWEDEIMMRFLPGWMRKAWQRGSGTWGQHSLGHAVSLAQVIAQRQAYNQRKAVLSSDQWIEESLGFTGVSLG